MLRVSISLQWSPMDLQHPFWYYCQRMKPRSKKRIAQGPNWEFLTRFCGLKEAHVNRTSFKPFVSVRETSYKNVIVMFCNNKMGGFACVIVNNPLHANLHRPVLVVCATCNCFDVAYVHSQWNLVNKLWKFECTKVLGHVIGHSSDDDSCCHQVMLVDFKSNACNHYRVPWDGQLFLGSKLDNGGVTSLHDQYYIHNNK